MLTQIFEAFANQYNSAFQAGVSAAISSGLSAVSSVLSAVLLVWVDVLATTIAAPQEVPVGVVTALVGVPAFAVLLAKRGRVS